MEGRARTRAPLKFLAASGAALLGAYCLKKGDLEHVSRRVNKASMVAGTVFGVVELVQTVHSFLQHPQEPALLFEPEAETPATLELPASLAPGRGIRRVQSDPLDLCSHFAKEQWDALVPSVQKGTEGAPPALHSVVPEQGGSSKAANELHHQGELAAQPGFAALHGTFTPASSSTVAPSAVADTSPHAEILLRINNAVGCLWAVLGLLRMHDIARKEGHAPLDPCYLADQLALCADVLRLVPDFPSKAFAEEWRLEVADCSARGAHISALQARGMSEDLQRALEELWSIVYLVA